jgi:two-component system nitrogen regulation sensor histidine kinase NtrY
VKSSPVPAAFARGAQRLVRDAWSALAALLVLDLAWWMRAPAAAPLVVALPLLLLLGLLAWRPAVGVRGARGARWTRAAFTATGVAMVLVAAAHHRHSERLRDHAAEVRAGLAREAGAALAEAFARMSGSLVRTAEAALAAPAERLAAFEALGGLLPADEDVAVVLVQDARPFAWAGRLRVPLDSLEGRSGVFATPFYVVAYAVRRGAGRTVVATSLVHADQPADRLSRPLDARVAAAHRIDRFLYGHPSEAPGVPDAVVLSMDGEGLMAARAVVPPAEVLALEARQRALPRAGALLGLMLLLLVAAAWRREGGIEARLAVLAVAFVTLAVVPLSAFSNVWPLFDPTFFFVREGWRFTGNAGALAISSALLLLALLSALRARLRPFTRTQALVAVVLVAGLGPFLLRQLAGGIQVPGLGIPLGLWIAWQVTLFLAAVTLLLLGVAAGQSVLGYRRGLQPWVAPAIAAVAVLAAPLVLQAPGRFPAPYPALWVVAIGALAFTRRAKAMVVPVAFVAACGAVTLVWFSAVRDRVELASRDVVGLGEVDRDAATLLQRYAADLDPAGAARSRVEALARFARSDLAGADYPAEVITWTADGRILAELHVGRGQGTTYGVNTYAQEAQRTGQPMLRQVPGEPGVHLVLAVPHDDGTATTVVLAPRTRLVAPDPYGAFLGFSPPPAPEPPYTLRVGELALPMSAAPGGPGRWQRERSALHGDWVIPGVGGGARRVHATVDLRPLDALIVRGVLLVLLDLAVLGAIWLLIVLADGALLRWWRMRRRDLAKSYRTRLSLALFACFLVPSTLFGLWSFQRLQADDRQSRDLLVRETLRGVAASDSAALAEVAARFETPLFLFADGLLVMTSDPLLDALAPVGRLLPPAVVNALEERDEVTMGDAATLGASSVRLGYRGATDADGVSYVLAGPARLDERLLDRRRNDLALVLLFALALGALGALWASGAASRQLSRPISELRSGALAVARGATPPAFATDPPVEFVPVFAAFRTMTADLAESRAALEAAERRLAATLRNVASGVIALDEEGRVTFSNPRAEGILGRPLAPGARFLGGGRAAPREEPLTAMLEAFRAGAEDDGAAELEADGRRLQVRVARLERRSRRLVVTIDDVTDVARAERVLAWGEMARQVAHEIKNPLTPMRLGMQHLRRARRDARVDFDQVLEENTARVLAEIDRLDEIARSFSRYGTAPVDDAAPTGVDVAAIARDVLELERMGATGIAWDAQVPPGTVPAAARERELREVLLNLLENARLASARRIALAVRALPGGGAEVRVEDDGTGIPEHLLARVFEPHFSTRTSGSGLGLAISRRLIERWGGTIHAERLKDDGRGGTRLIVRLAPPPAG